MASRKILSWNVNGLRAVLNKGFAELVAELRPDVLCLQEIKANEDQVDLELPGYCAHWHSAEKKGYSGTMILTRCEPLAIHRGLGDLREDPEGRCIAAEFDELFVVGVYTPNAQRDLARLPFRMEWDRDFLQYVRQLEQTKPVVFCGDLNVAHTELDLARPKQNKGAKGFTAEERGAFDRMIEAGFVDTFREFETGAGHYTWWSNWGGARGKNVGWRVDYVMISAALRPRLEGATIYRDVMGSDHCPVGIELA